MNKDYPWVDDYITQYVDLLNCKFINMNKEKRLKNITIMAKRLAEQGKEYRKLESDLQEAAEINKCSVDDLTLRLEFPEEIEW